MINVVTAQLNKGFAVGRRGVTRLGLVLFDFDMVLDKMSLLFYSHATYLHCLSRLIISVSNVSLCIKLKNHK